MVYRLIFAVLAVLSFFPCTIFAQSAPLIVSKSEILPVKIQFKLGRKSKEQAISCLDTLPGVSKKEKGQLVFKPLSFLVEQSKDIPAKLKLYKAMLKAGIKACAEPDYLSLDQYKGSFSAQQARILYDRFAFSADPTTIQAAVGDGLVNTVTKLTTYKTESAIDAKEKDLRCDGHLAGEENDRQCDLSDPNDFETYGARYGLYYRMRYTQNPYFEKMFMFLHNERMAASTSTLSYCARWAMLEHINMLRRAAKSGDFKQFMREYNTDVMGHLEWLSGKENQYEQPNEDYAREFFELGTTGPSDLDGKAVYSDKDIAAAAPIQAGNYLDYREINGHGVCVRAKYEPITPIGSRVIFDGTPYRTVVSSQEDILQAAFKHPSTAENLAVDIWERFINSVPSKIALRRLAKVIRDNDYNLTKVMRIVMKSKAVYASKSRNDVIKSPVDLVIGFLRSTGIPLDYYYIDRILEDLGQRPLLPPTVFGVNEKKLAGESFVLEWRNSLTMILRQSDQDFEDSGYSLHNRFLSGISSDGQASLLLSNRLADFFNLKLNQNQIDQVVQYLDYNLRNCYGNNCNGQPTYLERDQYDPHPLSENATWKLRGALKILLDQAEFRTM